MYRRLLCLSIACLLLTATTALARDPGQTGATTIPLPAPVPNAGLTYLGPQPEPPDLPVQDKFNPFEQFLSWLLDFGR